MYQSIYKHFFLDTRNFSMPTRFGLDWFLSAVDKVWERGKWHSRVDWLDMEQFTVDVLRSKELTDKEKVRILKEVIDAYTRRGHFAEEKFSEDFVPE